ncbi:hypothetical protein ZWY2020_010733 [Hordeum vulgare]|nr:hypothetical protein ZWY2020_010733 [Hordeum vulgare]
MAQSDTSLLCLFMSKWTTKNRARPGDGRPGGGVVRRAASGEPAKDGGRTRDKEHVLTGGQGLMVDGYCHLIQALAQKRLWQLKRECL